MSRTRYFSTANANAELRRDEYRVWAGSEARIFRSLERAQDCAARARRWGVPVQIDDANGHRVR